MWSTTANHVTLPSPDCPLVTHAVSHQGSAADEAALERQHAARPQDPAGFAGLELVADLALTTGGLGVAVAGLVDGEVAHQAAFHHFELIMPLVALGQGTAQLRQRDRGEILALGHGIGHQLAITAATGTLHEHIDLGQAIAVEIGDRGPDHLAVHRLANRFDRWLGAGGGDRELLLGALTAAFDLEGDAL